MSKTDHILKAVEEARKREPEDTGDVYNTNDHLDSLALVKWDGSRVLVGCHLSKVDTRR